MMNSIRNNDWLFKDNIINNTTYMSGCRIDHVSGHTYDSQIGEKFLESADLWFLNLYTGKYNCKFGVEVTYCNTYTYGFNTGW